MQVDALALSVQFNLEGGQVLKALGPLSLSIASGEFVALLGPSGCGKSTFIRVLAGLQSISSGEVRVNHQPFHHPKVNSALMFQDANLMPWRSVFDNIALPLELAGVAPEERYERVMKVIPSLGLAEFVEAYPAELSGGMAQRAALGRVLVQQPDILLLDEPFGALDAMNREKISLDLLTIWSRLKHTVIMVTHDINEAVLMADRVIVLSQRPGRLIADITVDLPRPRQIDMIYTPVFADYARQVRAAIDHS